MQILPATTASLQAALKVLANGSIVAHPTETCYGFACDLTNQAAVEKLFALKQRPAHMPVSGLFATVEEAKKYVMWNAKAEELAKNLPGPLTLILPLRTDAPHKLFPTPDGGTTLGVRVSSNALATELAQNFGRPISTSSANIHGQPNPYSAEDIQKQFGSGGTTGTLPDLILDGGTLPPTPPSTVVDLTGENRDIKRQGSISA